MKETNHVYIHKPDVRRCNGCGHTFTAAQTPDGIKSRRQYCDTCRKRRAKESQSNARRKCDARLGGTGDKGDRTTASDLMGLVIRHEVFDNDVEMLQKLSRMEGFSPENWPAEGILRRLIVAASYRTPKEQKIGQIPHCEISELDLTPDE